jgi:hypothetical protein
MKKWAAEFLEMVKQCCGAGAKSRAAKINLPPRAGAELRIAAQAPDPFYLAKTFREKIMVAEVFVNCYNFNPTRVKLHQSK